MDTDINDILKRIFPEGTVARAGTAHAGGFEVEGLARGSDPVQCEVLGRAQDRNSGLNRRCEHFLVRAERALLFFRMCTAQPGLGYEEFVCGWRAAPADSAEGAELMASAKEILATVSA